MKFEMNHLNNKVNNNFTRIVLTVVLTVITTLAVVALVFDVKLSNKLAVCSQGVDKSVPVQKIKSPG